MKRKNNTGFTLVELLAVIAVLATILVIAVPKINDYILNQKENTFATNARNIVRQLEYENIDIKTFERISLRDLDLTNLNEKDYDLDKSKAYVKDNEIYINLVGKGDYDGMYICGINYTTKEVIVESECPLTGVEYIETLVGTGGLTETTATNDGTTYDAGIRYVGATNAVANKVYFNCEATDGTNAYGEENYNYASSCETWRIIGVFDVEDGSGNTEKRMKIINTESTFQASWDSSASSGANAANSGYGINQWGPSTLTDADGNEQPYAGADLMQLLNGYYIGKTGSECKYNIAHSDTDGFSQTCTTSSLTIAKMKPLTSNALSMIEEAVWYTYATNTSTAETAYLQERGITAQYTGKICSSGTYCNDKVNRTTTWKGLVGLMSVSDIGYANGWLYTSGTGVSNACAITPNAASSTARLVWVSSSSSVLGGNAFGSGGVWPAVYLDSNIQITGGDGLNTPYKLKLS